MNLLSFQLAIVFTVKQIINNATELGLPWVQAKLKQLLSTRGVDREQVVVSWIAAQCSRAKYTTFDDYNEMVIQFGFVTMFAAAFPLAAVLAFLNNVVEVRVDSNKLLRGLQKPVMELDSGIGMWEVVLQLIAVIAVATNTAMLTRTSSSVARVFNISSEKELIFANVAAEHIFGACMVAITMILRGQPLQVRRERRGQQKWLAMRALPEVQGDDDTETHDLPGVEIPGAAAELEEALIQAAFDDQVPDEAGDVMQIDPIVDPAADPTATQTTTTAPQPDTMAAQPMTAAQPDTTAQPDATAAQPETTDHPRPDIVPVAVC